MGRKFRYPIDTDQFEDIRESGLKNLDLDDARDKLGYLIEDYEVLYGINNAGKTPGTRFRSLIHTAHAKTGEKVVILIDEYDSLSWRQRSDQT